MAAYYDYLPGAVQFRTPALDPSNEAGTFLSYKITDWCNKIGPNYAQVWTNHEEWEASDRYTSGAMATTDDAYIQIRLLGRDYRAGTLSGTGIEAWRGFGLHKRNSNRMLEPRILQKPSKIEQSGDYVRSNLTRNIYGHITESGNTLSNNYYVFDDADFSSPKITRVLYSDTPGNRYFAWQINGDNSAYMSGVVYEFQPRADLPPGIDPGWAIAEASGYTWKGLPTYDPDNLGNRRNYFESNGTQVTGTYAPGYTGGIQYSRPTITSAAIRDYHGDVVGVADNFFYGSNSFTQNYTYRINGKKYFAWTNSFLLPID
mgnify:CR=1 FL=1